MLNVHLFQCASRPSPDPHNVTDSPIDDRAQLQSALGDAYVVERQLGSGGMATVWLAHDQKHKRPVAIKVLHPHLSASLGADRFKREIEVAARLQHPHILSVHDSGDANGVFWFSMPFVEGETLRARLDRESQLPVEEAIRITREASQALQYAHEHGVVHRDIKPENLLLTRDGNTLVADFGIAQALGVNVAPDARQRLTETGLVIGTPQYMSPEQASGERVLDARTDMYSLATVLYEMLAGEPPFTGPNAQTVRAKMLSGPPPSVRRARPAITPAVDAALDRALALAPADRFATVAEFARTLATAETAAYAAPARAMSFRALAIGGTVALLLIAGGVFLWTRTRSHAVVAGDSALAVLPFENDGDTSNAYFADGITDEIRGKLTSLPSLHVIARASSNLYRRSAKSPQQIGGELGATYLLTGVVRWETSPTHGRRVRVSPELVQLSREGAPRTIWQQTYDTTLADVFQVQSSVAAKVAANLGVVLNPPSRSRLALWPTENIEAYDAYLRSTAFGGTDLPSLRRSLAEAERAVALDSNFATAWGRIGRLHSIIFSNGTQSQADRNAAHTATERGIALDSTSADNYIARAFYWRLVASDPARASEDLETALRLAPSSADAMRTLGQIEATQGNWEKGVTLIRRSMVLDPRSPFGAERLSRALLWLRRYPEARAAAEQGLAIAPENVALIHDRAMSYLGEGDLAGARRSLRQAPSTVDRLVLASFVGSYWDTYWVLDSADAAMLQNASVSAFDGDKGSWGFMLSEIATMRGDSARARAFADTAISATSALNTDSASSWQTLSIRALMYATVGKRENAVRDRDRGIAFALSTKDQWSAMPYVRHLTARIDLALGDRDGAIAQLQALLAEPYPISPAWLRIDPAWDALRKDPRFEKLANGAGK